MTCRSRPLRAAARTFRRRALLASLVALSACRPPAQHDLAGRATDEWLRTYPLEPGGQVEITNRNGRIDVRAVEGTTVTVRATRVVRAPSDEAARELLPRLAFREVIDARRVAVQTGRLQGIVIGVEIEVGYEVQVPVDASVRLRTSNGPITIAGAGGAVAATAVNGAIAGKSLTGGVTARATNADVTIDLAAVANDPVELRTTNGHVHLSLPRTANANLAVSASNGRIDLRDIQLVPFGNQSVRRMRGRVNGGGTPVELSAVNGNVIVEGR